jgi:hypothetical protein
VHETLIKDKKASDGMFERFLKKRSQVSIKACRDYETPPKLKAIN